MTFGLLLILLLVVLGIWYLLDRREKGPVGKRPAASFKSAPYLCVLCYSHRSVFGRMRRLVPSQLDCRRDVKQQLYWLGNHRGIVVAASANWTAGLVACHEAQGPK